MTNDLLRRVLEHKENKGKTFAGRYLANKLVYFEETERILDAIEREKQIKAGSRKKKMELVSAINPEWSDLYNEILDN